MSRTTTRSGGVAGLDSFKTKRRTGWNDWARTLGALAIGAMPWVAAHAQQPAAVPAGTSSAAVDVAAAARPAAPVNLAFFYGSNVPAGPVPPLPPPRLDPPPSPHPA